MGWVQRRVLPRLTSRLIRLDGIPYLWRFYVLPRGPRGAQGSPWPVSLKLHHILISDSARHMHDHPWWFVTLLLKGGYTENLPGRSVWRRRFTVIHHRATDMHSLSLPEGRTVWSLVLMGRHRRDWGYETEDGWVHHKKYHEWVANRSF